MEQQFREGILVRDVNKRYYLHEPDVLAEQTVTFTSGCPAEIWLNLEWIAGCIEGDGQDYWFFADGGGRFLLSECMKARHREIH